MQLANWYESLELVVESESSLEIQFGAAREEAVQIFKSDARD